MGAVTVVDGTATALLPPTTGGGAAPPSRTYMYMCAMFGVKSPNSGLVRAFKSYDDDGAAESCEEWIASSNVLGPRGTCACLMALLPRFTSLRVINLDGVGMDNLTCACLYDVARQRTSLTQLSVRYNNLCESAGNVLLRLVRCARHIQRIDYADGNYISDYVARRIEAQLQYNLAQSSRDPLNIFSRSYAGITSPDDLDQEEWALLDACSIMAHNDDDSHNSVTSKKSEHLAHLLRLAAAARVNNTWSLTLKGIIAAGVTWQTEGVRRHVVLEAVAAVQPPAAASITAPVVSRAVAEKQRTCMLKLSALVVRHMYPQYVE
eukprot:PhM_4_TR15156/c0_g1_i1/m.70566